jgi:hypothetical protein
MMVHQWLLRLLAIGWVLVPAAVSRVRLGACASGVVDTLAMAAFSSETSPILVNRSLCPSFRRKDGLQTRGAHARSSTSLSGSVPRLRYATSRPVAATGVTATSSYPMRPYGFNVASSSSGTPLSSTT